MGDLATLWLPILATAIAVFVASALVHMVFKWHHKDFGPVANEDEAMAALRNGGLQPGQYMMPFCQDMKTAQSEEMRAKYRTGPITMLTVFPSGEPTMGPQLGKWFVFTLVLAAVAAAISLQVFGRGGDAHDAAHLAALTSFLAYGGGAAPQAIWMGKPWSTVAKDLLDAALYGTVTGFVFLWLW